MVGGFYMYLKEGLNEMLLGKSLNDFYLVIIENRGNLLTDEEYEKIVNSKVVYTDASKEDIDDLANCFQAKGLPKEAMKIIYSIARIRHMGILTMINDMVYDIANMEFVDLRRNQIICFDNLANYYDDLNARVRFFTPEEEPQLRQKMVLLDVDDQSKIYEYESAHVNQKDSEDLTSRFLALAKDKTQVLSRKLK